MNFGSNIDQFKKLLIDNKLPSENVISNYCESDVYDNKNLYDLSKNYREKLLSGVISCSNITINLFNYYLTPDLEIERLNKIKIINDLLNIYKNNIINTNTDLGNTIKYIDEKKINIQSLVKSIANLDKELLRINTPIVFSKIKYTSEDFMFKINSFDVKIEFEQEVTPSLETLIMIGCKHSYFDKISFPTKKNRLQN